MVDFEAEITVDQSDWCINCEFMPRTRHGEALFLNIEIFLSVFFILVDRDYLLGRKVGFVLWLIKKAKVLLP